MSFNFGSLNPLGTTEMKLPVPETMLGDDGFGTPIAIPTPISSGGVHCCPVDTLISAAIRNWRTAHKDNSEMGAVIDIGFDIRADPVADYIPTHSSFVFNFGSTDPEDLGDDTGEDFTGGDPVRPLHTIIHDPVAIGTSIQLNEDDSTTSAQSVYFTPTLEMYWRGMRWWDQSAAIGDFIVGAFALRLTGTIAPEAGYTWIEGGNLKEVTSTWLSNYLLYQDGVDVLLGGPAELVIFTHLIGEADATFVFRADGGAAPSADTITLRGYDTITIDPPVSEIQINSCEIRFPVVYGSIPPL